MEREYFDSQGRSVSLGVLCQLEPEWAASRIADMEPKLAAAEKDAARKQGRIDEMYKERSLLILEKGALRVQLASLRKDKDMAVHLLRKWKAWWPEPYGNVSERAFWLDVDEFLAAIDRAKEE